MKTLKVTLKQHTPLIHFQHDQYGATLRASEVKPKLDEYIIATEFGNNFQKVKSYLKRGANISDDKLEEKFENGFRALDYQLKIVADEEQKLDVVLDTYTKEVKEKRSDGSIISVTKYLTEDYPMLLSNMGGKEDASKLVNLVLHQSIKLDIILKNNQLYEIIHSVLPRFFANTNFGQRSSKGFGSFTVESFIEGGEEKKVTWKHSEMYPNDTKLMRYEVDDYDFDELKKLFSTIDFYWKCLKSGINYTKRQVNRDGTVTRDRVNQYIKAYLYTYLQSKGWTWEKRVVKQNLNLEGVRAKNDVPVYPSQLPFFYARAHLGCPVNGFQYRIPTGCLNNKGKEKMENVDIELKNNRIERIPSPIIFKPVFHEILDSKTNISKQVVSIYILYDKKVENALQEISQVEFSFFRKKTGMRPVKVNLLAIDSNGNRLDLDFHDLIGNFHKHLKFKMVPRDFRWQPILDKEITFLRIVK